MTDRKPAARGGARRVRRGRRGLRRAGRRQPRIPRHLRMSAQRMRLPDRGRGLRLLDAGCGTGASTAALLSVAPQAEIVAVDASSGMLAEAAAKRWPASVRFVHSRIEDLADAGVDGPFDGIFAAYLLRNLERPRRPIADVPNAAAARRDAGGARVLGARLPAGDGRCGTRCARRSSSRWAGCGAATPTSTATCGAASTTSTVRRRSGTGCAANGFTDCAQRDHARLAAQHRAHLPRGRAAMTDPRRAHPPRTARPARRRRAGSDARTSSWSAAASPGWPRRPGWPNAASPSTSSSGRPISAAASAAGPRQADDGDGLADEPRLPRVLPPVLQPAGPVAPHRLRAGHAHRRSRTTRWSTRRAGATPSAACRRRRR